MPTEYNIYQQVYQLSMASNMVRGCTGTAAQLQRKISDALPGVMDKYAGPGWEVAWGPEVWKHDGATDDMPPDNVWFVAKNSSIDCEDGSTAPVYVVAIAATAGDKIGESYDWTHENFGVNEAVDFNQWIKEGITNPPKPWTPAIQLPKPMTARGTTNAIFTLANSPPVGDSRPLHDFLKNVPVSKGTRVIFTGQSLGGALSPALALTLKQAGCLDKFSQAFVYGSAGASPGNAKFSELFSQCFPPIGDRSTYKIWNLNLVNVLDPVPNAWCRIKSSSLNLGRIPTLYGKMSLIPAMQLATGVNFLRNRAAASMVRYQPLDYAEFPGITPVTTPKTMEEFSMECAKQHMSAYHQYVLGSTNIPPALGQTTPEEELYLSTPVLGCMRASGEGRVPEVPEIPDEDD